MRSFSERREINKLGLETFFLNLENNHYDYNINNLVTDLENKIKTLEEKEIKINSGFMGYLFPFQALTCITTKNKTHEIFKIKRTRSFNGSFRSILR